MDPMNLPDGLGDGGGAREAYVSLVRLLTAASPMASLIHASGDVLGAALVAPLLEWRDDHLMLGFSEGDGPEGVSQALIVWTVSARVPLGLWPSPAPLMALGGYLHVSLRCSLLEPVAPQRFRARQALVQGNLGDLGTDDLGRVVQALRLSGDDAQRAVAGVFSAWKRYAASAH